MRYLFLFSLALTLFVAPLKAADEPELDAVSKQAAALEGHVVEDEKDSHRRHDDDEREQEEPGDELAGAAGVFGELVVRGRRCVVLRRLGHRTGRYRLAWVIGFGTKIASFSQTVSQRRQDTQGPASTSAILWNVSFSGSSIR